MTTTKEVRKSGTQDWQAAGAAWGKRAVEWAYVMEPEGRRVYQAVLEACGVEAGTLVLDVACGAGLALHLAAEMGAVVSGIDASAEFLEIARARTPQADLHHGTMFDLPWPTASFDVVTSFFGIWVGCDDALVEAHRVLRPGGLVALAFFGADDRCPDVAVVKALQALMARRDARPSQKHRTISRPGVASDMLSRAGFAVVSHGMVETLTEWPDPEMGWRAWRASGMAWAAIAHSGEEAVREAVLTVLRPEADPHVGLRIASEFAYVVGRREG